MKIRNIDLAHWQEVLPDKVEIIEVGPRDGLQSIPDFILTEDKIQIIEILMKAGIHRFEISSFVHPQRVPQLRDAAEVFQAIKDKECQCFAMVPNLKGAERAIKAGVSMLNLVVSASESHNFSNVQMSIQESLNCFTDVIKLARQEKIPVRASISTAFGCPFEGDVPLIQISSISHKLCDMGCVEINLCDTTGMANPNKVAQIANYFIVHFPDVNIVMHFHNTRGMGSANVLSAIQNGITSLETSFGGLGGCPFAPGATGNVCTEDIVHMLHEIGIYTGVNLPCLIDGVRKIENLLRIQLPGQIIKAGARCELHTISFD
jgi:hydroxymethylglutaryl-CoA lyase